jgi:WD40 repeat protein
MSSLAVEKPQYESEEISNTPYGVFQMIVHLGCLLFSTIDYINVINRNGNKFTLKHDGVPRFMARIDILVSWAYDGHGSYIIKIWDAPKEGIWKCRATINAHTSPIWSVVFARNTLISADYHKTVVWDIKTGECLKLLEDRETSTEFTNGKPPHLLVSACQYCDKLISCNELCFNIWNLKTYECLISFKFKKYHGDLMPLASFEGKYFLIGYGNELQMFDLDGVYVKTFKGHTDRISRILVVYLSPGAGDFTDPYQIITGSWDNTIKIWNPETGKCLNTLVGHTCMVNHLMEFHGKLISGALNRPDIIFWDLKTGELIQTSRDHTKEITSIVRYKTGFFTSSDDNTIRKWRRIEDEGGNVQ